MNFALAKAIPIAEILAMVEVKPEKDNITDAMYPAPWRNECTASLHVNKEANLWYDHGEGTGGSAYDLVVRLLKFRGYSHTSDDVFRWLKNTNLDPMELKPRDRVNGKKSKWKLLDVMQLENLALIRYLTQRGINVDLARKYVCEIYVRKRETLTKIYAIGFKNEDGGYELRNRFFKGCVAPKTVTFVRADKPKPDGVMLFEGFMDFLTYVTIKHGVLKHDVIVLNSVACVDHAIRYINNYGYNFAYTWFHNDKAGEKAEQRFKEFIKSEPRLVHKPLSLLHKPHKDLNEWHMHKRGLRPLG